MIRRGTIGVAISCECGWESDAPALALKGRGFVRDAADPPSGAVRDSVLPICQHLGRGHVLVAVAEGALLRVRRRVPASKGAGPLRPCCGEDDPGIRDVVFPKFGHRVSDGSSNTRGFYFRVAQSASSTILTGVAREDGTSERRRTHWRAPPPACAPGSSTVTARSPIPSPSHEV